MQLKADWFKLCTLNLSKAESLKTLYALGPLGLPGTWRAFKLFALLGGQGPLDMPVLACLCEFLQNLACASLASQNLCAGWALPWKQVRELKSSFLCGKTHVDLTRKEFLGSLPWLLGKAHSTHSTAASCHVATKIWICTIFVYVWNPWNWTST